MVCIFSVYFVCVQTAAHCNTLQNTATHCNTLQYNATHDILHNSLNIHTFFISTVGGTYIICIFGMYENCNTLQHTATHCNTLQHIATHCNTLQHFVINHITLKYTYLLFLLWMVCIFLVYCNLLLYDVVCCGVLKCVAVCCRLLQFVAVCCGVLLWIVYMFAVCCIVIQHVAVCCRVLNESTASREIMCRECTVVFRCASPDCWMCTGTGIKQKKQIRATVYMVCHGVRYNDAIQVCNAYTHAHTRTRAHTHIQVHTNTQIDTVTHTYIHSVRDNISSTSRDNVITSLFTVPMWFYETVQLLMVADFLSFCGRDRKKLLNFFLSACIHVNFF